MKSNVKKLTTIVLMMLVAAAAAFAKPAVKFVENNGFFDIYTYEQQSWGVCNSDFYDNYLAPELAISFEQSSEPVEVPQVVLELADKGAYVFTSYCTEDHHEILYFFWLDQQEQIVGAKYVQK